MEKMINLSNVVSNLDSYLYAVQKYCMKSGKGAPDLGSIRARYERLTSDEKLLIAECSWVHGMMNRD